MTRLPTRRSIYERKLENILGQVNRLVPATPRDGEYRVRPSMNLLLEAFRVCGLPRPSIPTIHSRIEAVAYYTNDAEDAKATATAQLLQFIDHPEQLIHHRDLPTTPLPVDRTARLIDALHSSL